MRHLELFYYAFALVRCVDRLAFLLQILVKLTFLAIEAFLTGPSLFVKELRSGTPLSRIGSYLVSGGSSGFRLK